jgi:Chaperone of endosialidase
MSKGSAPTPPNPIATAGAQTASNVSTAVANATLNDVNQITPLGSLTYDTSSQPPFIFTDPTTGQTYNIPRFTATQALTPQEQAIQDQSQGAKFNLANLSNVQSGRIGDLLSSPIDLSGAPPRGTFNFSGQPLTGFDQFGEVGSQQYGFAPSGEPVYGWGDTGPITRTYGPADNFSADRARVEESLYGRLNPQLKLEQQHIEQQLADQGIRYGSTAYQNAMDSYNRQANDARLAVTQTAGQEQQRMMDMAAKRAGFENAAQLQDYQEQQGRAGFYNQAQQQRYQQDIGRTSFYNQAQQAAFAQNALRGSFYNQGIAAQLQAAQTQLSAQNQARSQYLAEQYAQRNQPINEISALLSGSQIQQPSFMQTPQGQIPTTDVANLINQNFAQQFGNYQQQVSQQNALIGGLFGAAGNIGAAALKYSDRRMKEDIHRIGSVFVAEPQPVQEPEQTNKKLPVYSYSYKDDPASTRHIGPMAQDVERIDPGAVHEIGGRKAIDTKRVMGGILRAA